MSARGAFSKARMTENIDKLCEMMDTYPGMPWQFYAIRLGYSDNNAWGYFIRFVRERAIANNWNVAPVWEYRGRFVVWYLMRPSDSTWMVRREKEDESRKWLTENMATL